MLFMYLSLQFIIINFNVVTVPLGNYHSILLSTSSSRVLEANLPRKVPKKNGLSGTLMTGETRLMNQLGRNGVIRRNMM